MLSVGFPRATVNLFVAQAAFECGNRHFNSQVARQDNNLTGINFINKPYQKNDTRGLAKPKSEGKAYYAHFLSIRDWAIDYKRILSFGSFPIDAKSPNDLAERLKENSYFASGETAYSNGVSIQYRAINSELGI
ncbi:MAG TPA: hypothetical protein VKR58_01640 [Aquella sp.]|nr:hypothetical protein [Aquella sp.]